VSQVAGSTRPGRVAYAVVHDDPPLVFIAEDEYVLSRRVALEVVASMRANDLPSRAIVEQLRACLLEERWADAIATWIEVSGIAIDAYPDEIVWTEAALDAERASLEMRMSPLFRD
jgi:hypothetical protein